MLSPKVLWLGIMFFLVSNSVMAQSSGILLRIEKDEVTIVAEGQSPAESTNRENIARKNAIQEAVRQVIGEQVKSETLVENFRLVYDRVFTKTQGFVKSVKAQGEPRINKGIFIQKYSLTVSTTSLDKALVETSIESEIDIPALYQTIGSPRIAMVISEHIVDDTGKKITKDPDLRAESIVQNYFKKRNSAFYFTSLPMLAGSEKNDPDWVSLGLKNNFDIVIIGDIKTHFLLETVKKIRGVGKDIEIPMYRYSSELTLNIINVSRAERVNTVNETFTKGDSKTGSNHAMAQKYAKDQVLSNGIPKLFSELMLGWVETVFDASYKLVFMQTSAADDFAIHKKLREMSVVVSENIQSFGSVDGKLTYSARMRGVLSEVNQQLSESFPDYQISESRMGQIVLTRAGSSAAVFSVEIRDVSFLQSEDYLLQLRSLPEISMVTEPSMSSGNAVYSVTTKMSGRKLAIELEKKLGVQVKGLSGQFIKAISQ